MSDTRTSSRRRRALRVAAPVAGLLAAGLLVWQGSNAAFTASTDNGSQNWATGTLSLTNDGGTGTYAASTTAIFNETNLKIPSPTVTKCLTVKAGGAGGTLKFYRGTISGTNSATLAPQISLTIKRSPVSATDPGVTQSCTGFNAGTAVNIATTTLSGLPTTYATGLGSVAVPNGPTQFVVYQFQYQLTSTGSNTTDNALQNSNAAATFNWEIQ